MTSAPTRRRFLFYMGHPAHYHNVSVAARMLADAGHAILFVARDKDVLVELVRRTPYDVRVMAARKGHRRPALLAHVLAREIRMLTYALRFRPDVLIGTDLVITHVAKLLRRPSLLLNEDDADQVPQLARYGYRFATAVMAPFCCGVGQYGARKIGYHGYHELAYLHPAHFTPDRTKIAHLQAQKGEYFILRFSGLQAYHDTGRTGITTPLAIRLIELLRKHGTVYITSERPLSPELERYRLPVRPDEIHHALAFARMYVGDSQTMAAEAAVLGTPSIRFNDFVGKLSYLEELEHVYGLTVGIRTNQVQLLLDTAVKFGADESVRALWQSRRERMLAETVDVASFFTERFLEFAEGS